MIFVTVGTDEHDFSRLVKAMDSIAGENVIMQIGHTRYQPVHATWFRFESNKQIAELYKTADIIVTHAGAGSIIRALSQGKKPVVVPREKRYGEHVNNHQLDLAQSLAVKGAITVVRDVKELRNHIIQKRICHRHDNMLAFRLKEWLIA